jgi:serine/threonine-protein kinase
MIPKPMLVLLILYLVFIGLLVATAGKLPERMATHFDFAGRPDGWMSRQGYLAFMAGFGLLFPLLLPLVSLGFRALPASVINIPHREYWLSPERREETNAYLVRHALWLAVLQLGFVIALHLLSVSANRQSPPHLSNAIWGATLVFLRGIGLWGWQLVRRFRTPRE